VTITVTIAVIISVTISVAFAVSIDVTTDLHLCLPCITNPLVDFNRVNFHLLILTGEFQLVHFIKVYSKWLHWTSLWLLLWPSLLPVLWPLIDFNRVNFSWLFLTNAMTATVTIAVSKAVTIAVTIAVVFAVSIDVHTDLHLCLPALPRSVKFNWLILAGWISTGWL
jgi:hypothetical protein